MRSAALALLVAAPSAVAVRSPPLSFNGLALKPPVRRLVNASQ